MEKQFIDSVRPIVAKILNGDSRSKSLQVYDSNENKSLNSQNSLRSNTSSNESDATRYSLNDSINEINRLIDFAMKENNNDLNSRLDYIDSLWVKVFSIIKICMAEGISQSELKINERKKSKI